MPRFHVAQRSRNVVQYTVMAFGGHFLFYEAPDLLIDDLRHPRKRLLVSNSLGFDGL